MAEIRIPSERCLVVAVEELLCGNFIGYGLDCHERDYSSDDCVAVKIGDTIICDKCSGAIGRHVLRKSNLISHCCTAATLWGGRNVRKSGWDSWARLARAITTELGNNARSYSIMLRSPKRADWNAPYQRGFPRFTSRGCINEFCKLLSAGLGGGGTKKLSGCIIAGAGQRRLCYRGGDVLSYDSGSGDLNGAGMTHGYADHKNTFNAITALDNKGILLNPVFGNHCIDCFPHRHMGHQLRLHCSLDLALGLLKRLRDHISGAVGEYHFTTLRGASPDYLHQRSVKYFTSLFNHEMDDLADVTTVSFTPPAAINGVNVGEAMLRIYD